MLIAEPEVKRSESDLRTPCPGTIIFSNYF